MILRPTSGPEDWTAFLAQPDLHWKPGRSAMELAHAWEGAQGVPPGIAALFPGAELLLAIPEFAVPLPGGDQGSHNDIFALLRDDHGLIVCMIEGKRDESLGPRLAKCLTDASPGKRQRLAALAGVLGLDPDALDPMLRYQLLHRAALALLTARRFHATRAAMIVQSFSPEHRGFDEFARFLGLFGVAAGRDCLCTLTVPQDVAFGCA